MMRCRFQQATPAQHDAPVHGVDDRDGFTALSALLLNML